MSGPCSLSRIYEIVDSKKNEIFAKLLYSDKANGEDYYKVPVKKGEYLVRGKVPETCREAGMMAVCAGDEKCRFTDNSCRIANLSKECEYTL